MAEMVSITVEMGRAKEGKRVARTVPVAPGVRVPGTSILCLSRLNFLKTGMVAEKASGSRGVVVARVERRTSVR